MVVVMGMNPLKLQEMMSQAKAMQEQLQQKMSENSKADHRSFGGARA